MNPNPTPTFYCMEGKNSNISLSEVRTRIHEKTDIHGYRRRLELAFKKIEVEDSFSEDDKKLVRDFGHYLYALGQNPGRVAKVIFQLIVLRRHMDCDYSKADRKNIEHLLTWLNGNLRYSAWTKSDAKGHIKRFYRWIRYETISNDQPFPPEVSWFSSRVKRNETKEPETFTTEEIEDMIRVASKMFDKAFIATSSEGGFRIGESLGVRIGDVRFDEHGARIMVTGKTGPRPVRLISSAPILSRYLEEHPVKDNPDAPLWISASRKYPVMNSVSYHGIQKMLKTIARKAGVMKRVHSHMFRHSAATRDAAFLTEAQLRIKYGWSKDSDMPSVYVHLSARDVDSKLISVYTGKRVEQQQPEFSPIICPRCNEKNTPGLKYCGRCALDLDARENSVEASEMQKMWQELQSLRELIAQGLDKDKSQSVS